MNDPRSVCWLNAIDSLEAAREMVRDKNFSWEKLELSQYYWAMLAEADLLVRLASVDTVTAMGAGKMLAARERSRVEARHLAETLMAKIKGDDDVQA